MNTREDVKCLVGVNVQISSDGLEPSICLVAGRYYSSEVILVLSFSQSHSRLGMTRGRSRARLGFLLTRIDAKKFVHYKRVWNCIPEGFIVYFLRTWMGSYLCSTLTSLSFLPRLFNLKLVPRQYLGLYAPLPCSSVHLDVTVGSW